MAATKRRGTRRRYSDKQMRDVFLYYHQVRVLNYTNRKTPLRQTARRFRISVNTVYYLLEQYRWVQLDRQRNNHA